MICTFYSYKGGVGRSMALANVGDVLSRRGLKVLMIDFDLEAPGLEQFFYRGDEREQRDVLRGQTGLLDLLLAYKESMSLAGGGDSFRDIARYVATIFAHRPGGGRLDLMPAGQRLSSEQLSHYAQALRTFDWQDFYFNWEGDLFFEWLRRALVPERYDVVLIDSRTGVTEMGGICGYQLADVIVMMCGANHQNVDGTWSMLHDFRSQPVEDLRRGRPLEIVVVPARLEQRAPQLTQAFYERFESRFAAMLPARMAGVGLSFRDLTIPYDPQFAFEERVARSAEEKAAKEHLGQVFGTLADVITLLVPTSIVPESALARQAQDVTARLGQPRTGAASAPDRPAGFSAAAPTAGAQYDETKRFADFDVLVSFARADAETAGSLQRELARAGLRVLADANDPAVSADWKLRMQDTLVHTRALAFCLGAGPLAASRQWLLARALQARDAGRALVLVPVLMPGHEADQPTERALRELPVLDLRAGPAAEGLARAADLLRPPSLRKDASRKATATSEVELEERCPYVGAMAFDEHQADLFFGRGDEVRKLVAALEHNALVLLSGASACGKSSLVRAGVLPALRRTHPDWQIVRVDSAAGIDDALAATRAPGKRVLIIDPSDASPIGAADGNTPAALHETLTRSGARALVCARSDRLGVWSDLLAQPDAASFAHVQLPRPGAAALRDLIERPADVTGLAFEPGLADRILNRAVGESGVLPFVQETLERLWRQRRNGWLTNAAYDSFGGLRAIVTEAADGYFDSLAPDDQQQMQRILLRLVQVATGSARSTAQRLPLDALGPAGSPTRRVIEAMVDAHLLVSDAGDVGPTLELAHEALARDWPRLLIWLEQERDFLAWRARLGVELETWRRAARSSEQLLRGPLLEEAERCSAGREADLHDDERDYIRASRSLREATRLEAERQRVRRLKVLTTAAGVFMVVATVAAVGWVQAIRQQDELERKSEVLLTQLKDLEQSSAAGEAERSAAAQRLAELEATLGELLETARRASDERDLARSQAADLERAVRQAREFAVEQNAFSTRQIEENTRQQVILREALKK